MVVTETPRDRVGRSGSYLPPSLPWSVPVVRVEEDDGYICLLNFRILVFLFIGTTGVDRSRCPSSEKEVLRRRPESSGPSEPSSTGGRALLPDRTEGSPRKGVQGLCPFPCDGSLGKRDTFYGGIRLHYKLSSRTTPTRVFGDPQ